MSRISATCALLFTSLFMGASAVAVEPPTPSVNAQLAAHQATFAEPRVFQISERIFVAYAYSMCNVIMVVGDESVAIFDSGFRLEEGRAALAALREHSSLPISALIYSHGHADHTGGSRAFAPGDTEPPVRVYAHANYQRYLGEINSSTRPVFTRRAVAQLGMILPEGEAGTVGTGGGGVLSFAGTQSYAPPTDVVNDAATIDLGGIHLELFHAPGDLDDALAAWIPEAGVLLTGDTVVGTHTHPILSTPRHEKGRDARAYVDTLNGMRAYPTQTLIGGHGVPVRGAAEVADLLERTEMVAQFMIDETLRLTRQNLSGESIAAAVSLPAALTGDQEFGDYYHRLRWIVRGVHAKEMGWYGGDVLELVAHAPAERARRLVDALGGSEAVLRKAEAAYKGGDPRWAAELATLVLTLAPEDAAALDQKSNALKAIAYASDSANERNYLLTEASVMSGELGWNVVFRGALNRVKAMLGGESISETALVAPSLTFIENMGPRLSVDRSAAARASLGIRVSDRDEAYRLNVRNGVMLKERATPAEPDAIISLDHRTLVRATEGTASWNALRRAGDIEVVKGQAAFEQFVAYFDW